MDQLHLAIRLDVLVPATPNRVAPTTQAAWPPTATGWLTIECVAPPAFLARQQIVYRGPFALRIEDYSRGSLLSMRYKYILSDLHLQLAKARLLHALTNLQRDGWRTIPIIRAVQCNELVDRTHVRTNLVWAIQVQYVSRRAAVLPRAGQFSAIVLSEIVEQQGSVIRATTSAG